MRHGRTVVLILATLLVLSLAACDTSDEQLESIRESNEAARSAEGTPEAVSSFEPSVSVFDLRVGDCVRSGFSGALEEMTVVSCESTWTHIAIDTFLIRGDGDFPGTDAIENVTGERCDRNVSDSLEPTKESWAIGDRTVTCFASKDSLVTGVPGECYGRSSDNLILPETQLSCSRPHLAEIFHVAFYPGATAFPGDDAVLLYAEETCFDEFERYVGTAYEDSEAYFNYYAPTEPTWRYAEDRRILCFLTSEDGSPVTGSYRGSRR